MAKLGDSVYVEYDGEQYFVVEVIDEEIGERKIRIFNSLHQEFTWDHPRYDLILEMIPPGFGSR